MKFFFIGIFLLFLLLLETTFFSFPFVLLSIFLLGVFYKEQWIFVVAFVMGILLDLLMFRGIGGSSIFFLCMMGIVFLYQRKYEIQSIPFIAVFSFCAVMVYGLVFGRQFIFSQALFGALVSGGIFFLLGHFNTKRASNKY